MYVYICALVCACALSTTNSALYIAVRTLFVECCVLTTVMFENVFPPLSLCVEIKHFLIYFCVVL